MECDSFCDNARAFGPPGLFGGFLYLTRSSAHLQIPRINARQPTRSKPYNTNHCEEEGHNNNNNNIIIIINSVIVIY